MRAVPVVLLGFGRVGQAFADLVRTGAREVRDRYELDVRVVAVRRSSVQTTTLEPVPSDTTVWVPSGDLGELLEHTAAATVVQVIPSSREHAEDAYDQALATLAAGAHLVTATKSHLAEDWSRLDAAAIAAGKAIRVSAAAGAALPAAELARRGVRALGCIELRGSLNGTSNFVLDALAHGRTLDGALTEARRLGIAEPDVSDDLSGADSAAKLTIITNLLWRRSTRAKSVATELIDAQTARRAHTAAAAGRALRAVARADRDSLAMSVSLEEVDLADPLFGLSGAEKLITFDCGAAGRITVTGGRSSPYGAAVALLKDVVNLATGDDAPGLS